jgi:hypothetical protein
VRLGELLHGELLEKRFKHLAGHGWFTPVILGTWEVEIRRIMVRWHPGQ